MPEFFKNERRFRRVFLLLLMMFILQSPDFILAIGLNKISLQLFLSLRIDDE